MVDYVVDLVEEHDGAGGSRFSESFLGRWHCNCFTVECGSPGIYKSMSSSILSRLNSLSMSSVIISRCTSVQELLVVRFHVYKVALIDREFAQLGFLQTDLCEL